MFFVIFPVLGDVISPILAAVLFLLTALTDMLDGKIARSRNLITDFGKFLDPLADKMLIFGAYLAILSNQKVYHGSEKETEIFFWIFTVSTFIIFFRELAVTSLRLLIAAAPQKKVVAAAWPGKVKTTLQMVCMEFLLIEPVVMKYLFNTHNGVSYVLLFGAVFMTIYSGVKYFIDYWDYIDPSK